MEALSAIAASAELHGSWALALLGGSVAAIAGTSHASPVTPAARSIYLLFIPGWIALAFSIHYGDLVTRGYLAAQLVADTERKAVLQVMNANYASQQSSLLWAVVLFSVWLVLYLIWWVFYREPAKEQ